MSFRWLTSIGAHFDEVMRYRKSRMPARIYLPLVLFLCTASFATGWPTTAASWMVNLVLAGTLLFQFRLWDDLSDVDDDRLDHPGRVLCQATTLFPFWLVIAITFAFNVTLIAVSRTEAAVAAFLILNAVMLVWYWNNNSRVNAVVRYHVVLIKYPVFVYLLCPFSNGSGGRPIIYAMGLAYLCFCVYELLHDQRLHRFAGMSYVLAAELVVLELLATLILIDLSKVAEPWAIVQAALAVLGAVIFVFLHQRQRVHTAPGRWCYAVFLIGFCWLLNYSIATHQSFANSDSSGLNSAFEIVQVDSTPKCLVFLSEKLPGDRAIESAISSIESTLQPGINS